MPPRASAYPDDLRQSRADLLNPPIHQSQAQTHTIDHARIHQGGGTTGAIGGARPADVETSALCGLVGEDIRAAVLDDDADAHWDAPLPVRIRLVAVGGLEVRSLRDAAAFLDGRHMTLEHSPALQKAAERVLRAARSGHPDDLADAATALHAYVSRLSLN